MNTPFDNLAIGSTFAYTDDNGGVHRLRVVAMPKDECERCYFCRVQHPGLCAALMRAQRVPRCLESERADRKDVIFVRA